MTAKIKTVSGMKNHKVVTPKEWVAARKKLLVKEKQFSKARDKMNRERRDLPWVKVEKDYVFEGPDGPMTFAEMFCGKSQLVIYHFMFGPIWISSLHCRTQNKRNWNQKSIRRKCYKHSRLAFRRVYKISSCFYIAFISDCMVCNAHMVAKLCLPYNY